MDRTTDKQGREIEIIFSRSRERQQSTLSKREDNRGNPKLTPIEQQAFSTENDSPFASFKPQLFQTGIFIVCIISIIFFVSCVPSKVNIKQENPNPGIVSKANIGDAFFEKVICYGEDNGYGTVFNGECLKYDLSLIGVTDTEITLQYREYTKPVNQYGGHKINEPWLVKDGFTRDLKYATKNREITYKNHVFTLLKVDSGGVTYQKN